MQRVWTFLAALALSALALPLAPVHGQSGPGQIIKSEQPVPNQYIVVLKDQAAGSRGARSKCAQVAATLRSLYGGSIRHVYQYALNGFSIQMGRLPALALSRDPRVAYVQEDSRGYVTSAQPNPPPWGLDRIDQRDLPLSSTYSYDTTGAGVNVYVIDTGILVTHEQFGGRATRDFDAFGDDGKESGHGTQVAGIIGGATYGVAKSVRLHSVRVNDGIRRGISSDAIAGVEWVTKCHVKPAVVNMSLQFPADPTLDMAVEKSIEAGVTYVVGAGNGTFNNGIPTDAGRFSPTRVAEAIVVGATDSNDRRDGRTNYGSVVDLFAPGTDITSAWNSDNTALFTSWGTSLAAPHVTGAVARYLQDHPSATPAEVSHALIDMATPGKVIDPGEGSHNRLLFIAPPSTPVTRVPMYETYHAGTTDHFYTTRESHRDLAVYSYGYANLGIPFQVEGVQLPGTVPLRRLYRGWPQTDHIYLTDWDEINHVLSRGWVEEWVEGYIYTSQAPGTVPLHRLNRWNGVTDDHDHLYTTDPYAVQSYQWQGWGYDRIQGYVWPAN